MQIERAVKRISCRCRVHKYFFKTRLLVDLNGAVGFLEKLEKTVYLSIFLFFILNLFHIKNCKTRLGWVSDS